MRHRHKRRRRSTTEIQISPLSPSLADMETGHSRRHAYIVNRATAAAIRSSVAVSAIRTCAAPPVP